MVEKAFCPNGCELPKPNSGDLMYKSTQILGKCCFCKVKIYDKNHNFLGVIKKIDFKGE